jgi:lipopolysaccharide transport system permease protein
VSSDRTDALPSNRVTVIQPRSGWHMLNFRELWAYRELLWVLTMRDIKVRYKQTVLGASHSACAHDGDL